MVKGLALAALLCLLLLATVLASPRAANAASQKVALVIGNAGYSQLNPLNNTTNDARAMAQTLGEIGFDATLVIDADEGELRKAIREFTTESAGKAVAVIFYAGHGVQVDGENYILPTDFEPPRAESDIKISGLKIDDMLAAMQARVKIVFLDACRDSPAIARRLANASRSLAGQPGLAPIKAADVGSDSGIFIAFATAAGQVAQDGDGQHSPFTQALLDNIKHPVSIDDMFSMVTKQVSVSTKNTQRPYKYASLDSIVCLTEACGSPAERVAALGQLAPGSVRARVTNPVDPNDRQWLLFGWGDQARGYLAPDSIKKIGERMVVRQKAVTGADAYLDMQIAVDCKAKTAGSYAGARYEGGQKVPKTEYLFPPDVLKLDPIVAGSFYDVISHFACGTAQTSAQTPADVVFSDSWVPVTLDAQSIKWSVLPNSLKKSGDRITFLAREEIPDGMARLPLAEISSIDVALPNLYAVVVLQSSIDCEAGELRIHWSEGWTKERAMTGKIARADSLEPLKISQNKVTADIGKYVCAKAGRNLVIQ